MPYLDYIFTIDIFNEGVDRQIVGEEIKSNLLDLCKSMDEVVMADVIYNVLPTSTHDIALFVKVDNEETLKNYATNPLHVEVIKNYIKPFVYDRVCIDFFE